MFAAAQSEEDETKGHRLGEELPKSTEVIDDGITAPVSVPKSIDVIDDGITAPVSVPKSTEVIDDGITAPVSVEPEEEFQLCITKGHRLGRQFN